MAKSRFQLPLSSITDRVFFDRREAINEYDVLLQQLRANNHSVLNYWGIGGIGKSRLLRYLHDRTRLLRDRRLALVVLDLKDHPTSASSLLTIYQQLPYPCYLYECALIRLYSLLGRPLRDLPRKLVDSPSIVGEVADYGRQAAEAISADASFVPGAGLLVHLGKTIRRIVLRYLHTRQDLLTEMTRFDSHGLSERLGFYLGTDISIAADRHRASTVLFVDSHERVKAGRSRYSASDDAWLRDLVSSSTRCLCVILGKERLRWDSLIEEGWAADLHPVRLGSFSAEDQEAYFDWLQLSDKKLRRHLARLCGGLPLLLSLADDLYRRAIVMGQAPTPDLFGWNKHDVVSRFWEHLSDTEQRTIAALAVPARFDRDLFMHFAKIGLANADSLAFDDIASMSCVEQDISTGWFRIHEAASSYIRESMQPMQFRRAAKALITFWKNKTSADDRPRTLLAAFTDLCAVGHTEVEEFLKSGIRFARTLCDAGYWGDVAAALHRCTPELHADVIHVLSLFEGIVARRNGKLKSALEHYATIQWDALGIHSTYGRFHQANALRLSGQYGRAMREYVDLETTARRTRDTEMERRIRRQRADLLMLEGSFEMALNILESLVNDEADESQVAEIMRQIAHIHRFNCDYNRAEEYYKKALAIATNLQYIGLRAKLLVNLVENAAYALEGRADGLEHEALALNLSVGTKLEVGKLLAARAIRRLLWEGDIEGGIRDSREARGIQQEVGYLGGVALAQVPRILCAVAQGPPKEIHRTARDLLRLVNRIGVYKFLLYPFVYIGGFLGSEASADEEVKWLDEARVQSHWNRLFNCIRRRNA